MTAEAVVGVSTLIELVETRRDVWSLIYSLIYSRVMLAMKTLLDDRVISYRKYH